MNVQKKLLVLRFVRQANSDKGTGLREFGDKLSSSPMCWKRAAGIKPLPLLIFSLNFPSLILGEMLAQYLNDCTVQRVRGTNHETVLDCYGHKWLYLVYF